MKINQQDLSFEKKPRLSITERATMHRVSPFRLTPRDIEVVKAVYRYRALSTPQIERLFFSSSVDSAGKPISSRCRYRLKMLFHHGYLFREEQPTRLAEGRKPLVYRIDEDAVPLLAAELGVFREDVRREITKSNTSLKYLDHLLSTNDVRIATEQATERNGYTIHRWLDEKALKSREMRDSVDIQGYRGKPMKITIVPDGYCYMNDGEYDYHNFFEIDRGTETVQSNKFGRRDFSRKIRGYKAYYSSGRFQERYLAKSMRILTVTTSVKRLENMKSMTEELGGGDLFWFTTFDQVAADTVMDKPIWAIAGIEQLSPLVW